jgi:predicted metal-dependent hydrolase
MNVQIDEIIRTHRKTIALEIQSNARLIVRAPYRVSEKYIQDLVNRKSRWIFQKKTLVQDKGRSDTKKEFVNGEEFLYMGDMYKLHIVDRPEPAFTFDKAFYLSTNYLPQANEIFIQWYKQEALKNITQRTENLAQSVGLNYEKIKISNATKRWGSCSHNGNMNFNWRLIMAPSQVIDYVIAHELAHLTEKNHSKAFWNRVSVLFPGYEQHKDWLKKNGHILKI